MGRRPILRTDCSFDPSAICGINPSFPGLSPSQRYVTYVLLTRPPLYWGPKRSLDLHVLSPPLAFALSQDQTLQLKTFQDISPG